MIPYCILIIEDDDDREFMTWLFQNYNRLMYREIFQLVQNVWVTEDLIQDVLVSLIDKVKELRLKDERHLVNYIITASKNKAKNYLRDTRIETTVPFDEQVDYPDPANNREEMERYLVERHNLSGLAHIWSKMDARSRSLLRGYYILGKTTAEIGVELGIKPESVRMALTRARKSAYELLKLEIITEF